ncbi:MAG: hypothetical protein QMD77_03935 [Patescibacteria group bacterium]|nr:hypothetical protein [Patescibacteria group bacterium]
MEKECCERLDPAEWDQKEIIWRDKPFLKDHYWSFLHVPIDFGKKIVRGLQEIKEAGLASEQMVLSKCDGLWGGEMLIPISKKTDRFETELITGKFLTRLFEGHYGDMRKWIKETEKYCEEKRFKAKEFIFFYATCPKCAKKYGDQAQVVVFGRVG